MWGRLQRRYEVQGDSGEGVLIEKSGEYFRKEETLGLGLQWKVELQYAGKNVGSKKLKEVLR